MAQDRIQPLVPGDSSRTMFSAEVANELINAINSFLAMEGRDGIRVIKSEGRIVLAFSGSAGTGTGEGGDTTYNSATSSFYCTCRYT